MTSPKSQQRKMGAAVASGLLEFGHTRVKRIASALYRARYELAPPNLIDNVGETLDYPRVNDETRTQWLWAAVVALRADQDQ